ncbi:MAG: VWA domain-containing protein [Acidobacteriia bacterium]|nr:VWA domain-containing protein [Terriglobia bacterium]
MGTLVWILKAAVLAVLCVQPLLAQIGQDEVHFLPPSRPARLAEHQATLKTNVDLVLVHVTVTDSKDRIVSNLQAGDFSVLDGKHPQNIRYLSSEDAPISIAVIFDASGSMRNKLDQARDAAIEFFRYSNPQDEFAVVTFADTPRLLAGFSDSVPDIESVLHPIQADGETALWDAVYLGLGEMRKARFSKKALLVISDGGDNHSRSTEAEIKSALREADVQLYAIDIFERYPKTPEERSGLLFLDEVTSLTGGRVFLTHDSNELHRAVRQISDALRTQYVLGYLPGQSARNGKWHKIKVELKHPNPRKLRAYAKKGYYGSFDRYPPPLPPAEAVK